VNNILTRLQQYANEVTATTNIFATFDGTTPKTPPVQSLPQQHAVALQQHVAALQQHATAKAAATETPFFLQTDQSGLSGP